MTVPPRKISGERLYSKIYLLY